MTDSLTPQTSFTENEYIFKEGDPGDCAYIIHSGDVEILLDRDGHEFVIARLSEGDILGEMALIDKLPRSGSARASSPTVLTEIPLDHFNQKIEATDRTIKMFLRLVIARYRDLNTRLGEVANTLSYTSNTEKVEESASTTTELEYVTSRFMDLHDRIDSALKKSSIESRDSPISDQTLEFAKVSIAEEKLLKQAVEKEQFELYYQPIVQLDCNKISGCEALIRWNHPSGEILSPASFIDQLESNGLIIDLGYWIAEQACRFQKRIYEQFRYDFFVAINLSGYQFKDRRLITNLADIMQKTGVHNDRITFEITESLLLENPDAASQSLYELKETGAGLAIDDFGTGYSSFSYLYKLPFDKLKIDRSFVNSMINIRKSSQIVKSMINMSLELEMSVVAEGIESRAEAEMLRHFKSTYGQGYHFSKPLCEKVFFSLISPKVARDQGIKSPVDSLSAKE